MKYDEFDGLVKRLTELIQHYPHGVNLHTLTVSSNGSTFYHSFTDENILLELRSLSKLVVALCYGILMGANRISVEGKYLSPNTKVWPHLKRHVRLTNDTNLPKLECLEIQHLFTQTTGFDNEHLLSTDSIRGIEKSSLLEYILNEPMLFWPGEKFVYSNASAYILSAFFQLLSEENLYSFAARNIFSPLGFAEHHWSNYGDYCVGATGLSLFAGDVHKLGALLLHNGVWNNEQIIPHDYVKLMFTPQVSVDHDKYCNPLSPKSYAYFIWIADDGVYYINGANGKFIIVVPDQNLVISIMSESTETHLILECVKAFI